MQVCSRMDTCVFKLFDFSPCPPVFLWILKYCFLDVCLINASSCFCFSPSVSTSRWTSGGSASGGSSRSTPSCTWAACSSSSASPSSCSARGTTCRPSTASCEWWRFPVEFSTSVCVSVAYKKFHNENATDVCHQCRVCPPEGTVNISLSTCHSSSIIKCFALHVRLCGFLPPVSQYQTWPRTSASSGISSPRCLNTSASSSSVSSRSTSSSTPSLYLSNSSESSALLTHHLCFR